MKDLLPWLATLTFAPKIIISTIVVLFAGFILLLIWSPRSETVRPNRLDEHAKPSAPKVEAPAPINKFPLFGDARFDYSNNDGNYTIGEFPYDFETKWSKASDASIYVYNDRPSVNRLGLVTDVSVFSEIDVSKIDMTSRSKRVDEGGFVVIENVRGYFAALRVNDIKDRSRSDKIDELAFRYIILRSRDSDFSAVTE